MTALVDTEQRRLIASDTDVNLFVEAGGGSGKTKSLIERVTTLVLRDGQPLSGVAAVTFTETRTPLWAAPAVCRREVDLQRVSSALCCVA